MIRGALASAAALGALALAAAGGWYAHAPSKPIVPPGLIGTAFVHPNGFHFMAPDNLRAFRAP